MLYYDMLSDIYFRSNPSDICGTWSKLVAKYNDEYRQYLSGEVGIEPFITFTEWIKELSGYSGRGYSDYFAWRYSDFVKMFTIMQPYCDAKKGEHIIRLEYSILPKAII